MIGKNIKYFKVHFQKKSILIVSVWIICQPAKGREGTTKSTIPEPAKHRRPDTAPGDGEETLPARLQTMTDDEAYDQFIEHYKDKVNAAMKERSERIRQKYRNETEYNSKVIQRLDNQENWFPGKTWFLNKKPVETKLNNDHTTGLCKDCHSIQLNYSTLLHKANQMCQCKTTRCPNWICLCRADEECLCLPVCNCDDCCSCQVKYITF